ncbi:HD family phosphohydrolase [Clostridium polyendosporum]|uniref:HD family phosphohydrolase n=1 Tax=Clostridium polyendosporum TaxID=69208 RepID=A0A919VE05_9CLOT|nr:HD domain-containing protein [Clostridium polyendosporum]GIM28604.1 HD family phosphohydrolase [Clostridium polyendosporum]
MKSLVSKVTKEMITYFDGDTKRINHALKVYSFSKTIGELENISPDKLQILELAAILHDIGIKVSEQKYNSSSGNYQQIEGPPVAKEILNFLQVDRNIIERVCFLIGNHHTYSKIDGIDFQILVEADFLVNIYEDNLSAKEISSIREKIFITKIGKEMLKSMYK